MQNIAHNLFCAIRGTSFYLERLPPLYYTLLYKPLPFSLYLLYCRQDKKDHLYEKITIVYGVVGAGLFADKEALGRIPAGQKVTWVSLIGDSTPLIYFFEKTEESSSCIPQYYISIGTERHCPFDADMPMYFADGIMKPYAAKQKGLQYIHTETERYCPFDDIWQLDFAPDGKTLVYGAEKDGMCIKKSL